MNEDNATTVAEIRSRWAESNPEPQCEAWWYSAIRHCQRNVEELCSHEGGYGGEDEPDAHPSRYDGTPYAHAAADIHFLLSLIKDDE